MGTLVAANLAANLEANHAAEFAANSLVALLLVSYMQEGGPWVGAGETVGEVDEMRWRTRGAETIFEVAQPVVSEAGLQVSLPLLMMLFLLMRVL